MRLGVPRSTGEGERRVAITPDAVDRLHKLGLEVAVEAGAGASAGFDDEAYTAVGAVLVTEQEAWAAPIVACIEAPAWRPEAVAMLTEGATLVGLVDPARNGPLLEALAAKRVTVVALDRIPRITRAQKMDVLSSMANIAGYRAVIEASHRFPGFFTPQMTAAGKSPPARVMVIGAGVAGLAAVGAARALGAEVRAFDVRPACREQVESMGAAFLEVELEDDGGEDAGGYAKVMSPAFIEAELALFMEQAREVDIIITTAQIPGRDAPELLSEEHVRAMKPGSVIVDLAAATGGNCANTIAGQVVDVGGVRVVGLTDLTSRMAPVASRFFARNLANVLGELLRDSAPVVDLSDEVFHQSVVAHEGAVRWPIERFPKPPAEEAPVQAAVPAPVSASVARPKKASHGSHGSHGGGTAPAWPMAVVAVALLAVGAVAPSDFLQHVTVFVLACFVGWQLVWNVTPALHTPLMSVTNAISGIIVIGGLVQAGRGVADLAAWLGAAAILLAAINIAGGFLVTQRMLRMFQR